MSKENGRPLAGSMKAQFKYAFMTGLHIRAAVFAVITAMMLIFIILGALGWLPFAAHITAISLGGCAVAAMLVANIISDVAIARRMFAAPDAYLYALTPAPRGKTLLASVVTMMALDIVTMAAVIIGETWLSLNFTGFGDTIWSIIRVYSTPADLLSILLIFAGYLLFLLIILFSAAAKKSLFFKMPASGLLAFLLACGCIYAASLLQLIFVPFTGVWRYGIFLTVPISSTMLPLYVLLILLEAAALFALTSKLMERKMNI